MRLADLSRPRRAIGGRDPADVKRRDPAGGTPDSGVPSESPETQARSRALRLLARREKSRAGLSRILRRNGFDAATTGRVVEDLAQARLVDDLRYCRLYLGEQARSRPRSIRLLKRDLRAEGIDDEVVDRAIAEMGDELEEQVLAEAAARKKLRAAGSDPERLRRLLTARGFAPSAIRQAIQVVLAASREASRGDAAPGPGSGEDDARGPHRVGREDETPASADDKGADIYDE